MLSHGGKMNVETVAELFKQELIEELNAYSINGKLDAATTLAILEHKRNQSIPNQKALGDFFSPSFLL